MPEPKPLLEVRDLAHWREWLSTRAAADKFVWLVFRKDGTSTISYDDALDEALCWGWIDSIIRRIDDDRYARKFTRRTNAAKWSAVNIGRLRRLLESKRMQPAGRAVIAPEVLARLDEPAPAKATRAALPVPAELSAALRTNAKARAFFDTLAPSYRRYYCGWILAAKQADTRERRAKEAVTLLAKGVKALLK